MTKQEFIKNNRGIDGGSDINEELLSSFFEQISQNQIQMDETKNHPKNDMATSSPIGLLKMNDRLALKTEKKLKKQMSTPTTSSKRDSYRNAIHIEHVKPMVEAVWMAVLSGLGTSIQEVEDEPTIKLILKGFKHSINVCCLFKMSVEKEAFLQALCKLTKIDFFALKPKTLEAIRTLISVAIIEGNNLDVFWSNIVSCISQLKSLDDFSVKEDIK
jgi:brefeldin A-inhibited guanine nucleotide-exchange protein